MNFSDVDSSRASSRQATGQPQQQAARPMPRCSLAAGISALYVLSLRQHQHGKRWLIMALLLAVPAMLAVLLRLTGAQAPSRMFEFYLAFMFMPQALIPLTALVYASGVIQDEQEDQTLTYLLTRPIAKWLIYSVKLAAAITVMIILVVAADALTYAAIYAGAAHGHHALLRWALASLISVLAVTTYGCLFGFLGVLTKRVLVAGLIYIALVEGLLANLPFSIRNITVIYYTRLIAYRTLPFVTPNANGSRENLSADTWHLTLGNHGQLVGYPQTLTCVLVLLAGGITFAAAAAWLSGSREFYVKTPDKL